jgi:plasmid rolling circle replication initiator protein Rep
MGREKTQINKIRKKRGRSQKHQEIQEIIRDYFENIYSNKLENPQEMNKFLDTYDQLKLSKEDINHLNRSITSNEIERAIKSLPKRICQDLTDSLLHSTMTLKKN